MSNNQTKEIAPFFRYLNKITDVAGALTAIGIFAVVIIQIIGRLIGHSAPWTEESTRYIFIWMIFLGIGIGFRKVESPRVTVLLNIMPKFIQRLSKWIYSIATIGFFVFMVVYGIELVRQQVTMNEISSVLLIPMWIIGISIPFSAVIGILNTIQSLIYDRDLI